MNLPKVGKGFAMQERIMITDPLWRRIAPLLPGKVGDPGRSADNNRLFVEGVLYVSRTGTPWRDLPPAFGKWNSVYKRFARWQESGVWERVFAELADDAHFREVSIDSTVVRAHHHAAGAQKKKVHRLLAALAEDSRRRSTA